MTDNDRSMAFTEHLRELRKRLIVSIIAAAAGFAVAYYYSAELYHFLALPLLPALPPGQDFMIFTGVVEPFFIYMKVGFAGGLVLASPVILFEVWGFVAPALYRNEKTWFVFIVFFSVILFLAGTAFAYLVVFPFGFKYLMGYSSPELKPLISMSEYFSMITKFLLAFGIIFQLPLAILVLARLGLVTARKLVSWWRYAIVITLVVSAVLTPTPDIFNQLLMAGPIMALYIIGIVVAVIFGKKKEGAGEEAEEAAEEPADREPDGQ
ncbi:MAG TPA: twin-arginine translocase subunit TatC [Thermodesulfobacteriota bacterium]|nr:twin-arginine translocase subunit TatC [Thermodesulfobacteriota bacterium]